MSTPVKRRHAWSLYFFAILSLCWGGGMLLEYQRKGTVADPKHRFIHSSKEALVVAWTPLVVGVIMLGVAVWGSIRRPMEKDNPPA